MVPGVRLGFNWGMVWYSIAWKLIVPSVRLSSRRRDGFGSYWMDGFHNKEIVILILLP